MSSQGRYFDRVLEVMIGDTIVTDLHVSFKVVRDLKKEPNTAAITIFDLNSKTRSKLEAFEEPIVQLKAGYKEGVSGVLFLGDVRGDIESNFEAPSWVTTIEAGDGEKARFSRINKSFAKGTPVVSVLRDIVKAINVDVGNLATIEPLAILNNNSAAFVNGVTVSGQAKKQLARIARSAGLEWSIQEGKFQFLQAGKSLLSSAVVLNSATGLIGTPRPGKEGRISLRALINSDIIPGKMLVVTSKTFSGLFRAERCEYVGSNFNTDFYVDVEAKKL